MCGGISAALGLATAKIARRTARVACCSSRTSSGRIAHTRSPAGCSGARSARRRLARRRRGAAGCVCSRRSRSSSAALVAFGTLRDPGTRLGQLLWRQSRRSAGGSCRSPTRARVRLRHGLGMDALRLRLHGHAHRGAGADALARQRRCSRSGWAPRRRCRARLRGATSIESCRRRGRPSHGGHGSDLQRGSYRPRAANRRRVAVAASLGAVLVPG